MRDREIWEDSAIPEPLILGISGCQNTDIGKLRHGGGQEILR